MENKVVLPITFKYADKLDLASRLLDFYSSMIEKLTPRSRDILIIAIVFGINNKDFRDLVIEHISGIKTKAHVNVEIGRLKKRGLISDHSTENKKILHPHIDAFYKMVNFGKPFTIELNFSK